MTTRIPSHWIDKHLTHTTPLLLDHLLQSRYFRFQNSLIALHQNLTSASPPFLRNFLFSLGPLIPSFSYFLSFIMTNTV